MIIQCVNCGYCHNVNYNLNAKELEQEIHEIVENGWRYSPNFQGYVCSNCKQDKLHETFCGKVRKTTKEKTYMRLLYDVCDFIQRLNELKEIFGQEVKDEDDHKQHQLHIRKIRNT